MWIPILKGLKHLNTVVKGRIGRICQLMKLLLLSNSEHLPFFRAPHEGKGCSPPVHGRGALCPGPCKKISLEGDTQHTTHGRTSRLLDQIGPVGRFGENKPKSLEKNVLVLWSPIRGKMALIVCKIT